MYHPDFGTGENEKQIFDALLKPEDSYTKDGIYWADLPIVQRIKFTSQVDGKEARRELSNIWAMTKEDPLAPVRYYFKNMVLPGAGLGLEGYVLFSIGNLGPLFQRGWPTCWSTHEVCDKTWVAAVDYLEICGIICGQIIVGFVGDWIGRRWGLIQDATIMFMGLLMLTASWGTSLNGWVICYAWSLFFYSVGVGGEYPMTATSGMENAVGSGKVSTAEDRLHRGRKVTSAFLMQGWGQLFNQAILIICLLCFHHGSGNPPYSHVAIQWTYRVSFGIPAIGTLWLVYYRYFKMRSAGRQLQLAKKKSSVTGYDTQSLKMTIKYFGGRLLATAGGWYMNDIFFYGNKLFQGEFIGVITHNGRSVMPGWLYNLINIGVSLVGYYLASFLIDNKIYGRKHMQTVGFLMIFICFIIPAFNFEYFQTPGAPIKGFQALYFLSSFFNQFGPNSVTFIVAAEVYPTPVRATAHGFSAAMGKMGALTAAVLYNYIDNQTKFYVVPWFGLAGVVLTVVFLPDTTGLDLKEQERRWTFLRDGREHEYHGIAIHPRHLSLWERMMGIGKNYDPELDYQQRIHEMRGEWELRMAEKAEEKAGHLDDSDFDDSEMSTEMTDFFRKTSKRATITGAVNEKSLSGSGSDDETRAGSTGGRTKKPGNGVLE